MKKLKIGVIGTGGMGSAHCKWCTELEETELAAVCDIDIDVAKQLGEKYNVPYYKESSKLIDSGKVDAVIVATPHYFHPPIGIYAMKKGLHFLSEKPLSVTVDQVDKMISVANKTKKVFSVMLQWRTEPTFKKAKEIIEQGKLGKIYRTEMILAWFRTQAYYNTAVWRASWKTEGGGVLVNQAPHALDIFTWLCGLPSKVYAKVFTKRHKIEVEDEVHAILEYPEGATGYLYASVNESPGTERIEIVGEKGKILIEGMSSIKFCSLNSPVQEFCDTSSDMWGCPTFKWEEINLEKVPAGHKEVIKNFARAVLYREKQLTRGQESIDGIELANALLLSGMKEEEVKLPVNRKKIVELYKKLVASSKPRKLVSTKRETDPGHIK